MFSTAELSHLFSPYRVCWEEEKIHQRIKKKNMNLLVEIYQISWYSYLECKYDPRLYTFYNYLLNQWCGRSQYHAEARMVTSALVSGRCPVWILDFVSLACKPQAVSHVGSGYMLVLSNDRREAKRARPSLLGTCLMPESLELGAQTLQGCLTLSWEWGPQPQLWVEGHFGGVE